MQVNQRNYDHQKDYERTNDFLVRTCGQDINGHVNWFQPRWEYMHYHPNIKQVDLQKIGVWESDGEIVGMIHPEFNAGVLYVEIHPEFSFLKREMLEYGLDKLFRVKDGKHQLFVYLNDNDREYRDIAGEMGFGITEYNEPMSAMPVPDVFPESKLPDGFCLQSLEDENDLRKIHRVLWRGFNHGDEPDYGELWEREFMQSAPNFNKGINVVAVAPDGNYVSFSGMWFEPVHKSGNVEPVATDPDYRRMGLASAAIFESIRRCADLGATKIYVGSTLPLYQSMGFKQIFNTTVWKKEWE